MRSSSRPHRSRPLRLPLALGLVALAAPATLAQSERAWLHGAPGERLGERFAVVGDLDGDGLAELVVGRPADDTAGADAGRVDVLRGVDGAVLFSWLGADPGDRLGETVAHAGDVDLDGVPDVLYGTPWSEAERGTGVVRSGATGAVIHLLRGLAPGDRAGFALAGVGDVDADGHADLAVGAPGVATAAGADAGRVYLVSGATGGVPWTADGVHAGVELGRHLFAIGDVTADGVPDLVAASPLFGFVAGTSRVLSGADGALVRAHDTEVFGHIYETTGFSACAVGDLDLDGTNDYALGWTDTSAIPQVRYHSGATGLVLRVDDYPTTWNQELALLDVGDQDGDGVRDQIVGFVNVFGAPRAYDLVSGATGAVLAGVVEGKVEDELGTALRAAGDVDGDGRVDAAFGIPGDGAAGADAGAIVTFSLVPAASPLACASTPNSTGETARLFADGPASVSANALVLTVAAMPASSSGLVVYGPAVAPSPLGNGVLCLDPAPLGFLLRLPPEASDASGVLRHALDLTAPPDPLGAIAPGSTWYFQGWFRDLPAGGAAFDFSDLLELRFYP